MTYTDLFDLAPTVINELTVEFVRRGKECMKANKTSQETACLMLAMRASSLLRGIGLLMQPATLDSKDVVTRAFMEARDLLITFRFDNKGTRDKIGYWFAGKIDQSWKADHKKCEEFLTKLGTGKPELARRWSMVTALSHPTVYAAGNSASYMDSLVSGGFHSKNSVEVMESKIVDYLGNIASLIAVATLDVPGWIPLHFNPALTPNLDAFHDSVYEVAIPILNKRKDVSLPKGSFRE
jgi:hypothetical protein